MGALYDACQKITAQIDRSGMDVFRTRGAIAMRTGFLITLIKESDEDDPVKLEALREACREVLGVDLGI